MRYSIADLRNMRQFYLAFSIRYAVRILLENANIERIYATLSRKFGDNPTIGLVLCTEKNEAMVHYSVLKDSKQLFASKYKLYFPSEKELKKEVERKMPEFRALSA